MKIFRRDFDRNGFRFSTKFLTLQNFRNVKYLLNIKRNSLINRYIHNKYLIVHNRKISR